MIEGRSGFGRARSCRCISLVVVDDECASAVDIKEGAGFGKTQKEEEPLQCFDLLKKLQITSKRWHIRDYAVILRSYLSNSGGANVEKCSLESPSASSTTKHILTCQKLEAAQSPPPPTPLEK